MQAALYARSTTPPLSPIVPHRSVLCQLEQVVGTIQGFKGVATWLASMPQPWPIRAIACAVGRWLIACQLRTEPALSALSRQELWAVACWKAVAAPDGPLLILIWDAACEAALTAGTSARLWFGGIWKGHASCAQVVTLWGHVAQKMTISYSLALTHRSLGGARSCHHCRLPAGRGRQTKMRRC